MEKFKKRMSDPMLSPSPDSDTQAWDNCMMSAEYCPVGDCDAMSIKMWQHVIMTVIQF